MLEVLQVVDLFQKHLGAPLVHSYLHAVTFGGDHATRKKSIWGVHLHNKMSQGFEVLSTKPYVLCKIFEDNAGALELAHLPKLHP